MATPTCLIGAGCRPPRPSFGAYLRARPTLFSPTSDAPAGRSRQQARLGLHASRAPRLRRSRTVDRSGRARGYRMVQSQRPMRPPRRRAWSWGARSPHKASGRAGSARVGRLRPLLGAGGQESDDLGDTGLATIGAALGGVDVAKVGTSVELGRSSPSRRRRPVRRGVLEPLGDGHGLILGPVPSPLYELGPTLRVDEVDSLGAVDLDDARQTRLTTMDLACHLGWDRGEGSCRRRSLASSLR